MKELVIFLLNLPFTMLGIIPLILSIPFNFKLHRRPLAFIFNVKSFWWGVGFLKFARAITIGYIVFMGPKVLENDLGHEIVHVNQVNEYPVIFPFLYLYERIKKGYRMNRFEDEAYRLSNSVYKGKRVTNP